MDSKRDQRAATKGRCAEIRPYSPVAPMEPRSKPPCASARLMAPRISYTGWAIAAVSLVSVGLRAQEKPKKLDLYFHTAWTSDEGAPAAAQVTAQSSDGYLWFGTPTGLIRFDGVRFERYQSPQEGKFPASVNILTLLATPDGGLWIGYYTGGASFLRNDKIVNYGEHEGSPTAQLNQFAFDAAGILWAATGAGLKRFHESRWETVGAGWGNGAQVSDDSARILDHTNGLSDDEINALFEDREGNIWVATRKGVDRFRNCA